MWQMEVHSFPNFTRAEGGVSFVLSIVSVFGAARRGLLRAGPAEPWGRVRDIRETGSLRGGTKPLCGYICAL